MEKQKLKEKKFSQVLIAKNSPSNCCYCDDDEILLIVPKKNVPIRDYVPHVFSAIKNKKMKSKYGWIKSTNPFTLTEFINTHFHKNISNEEKEHLLILLESIESLPEGTPVAATYNKKSAFDDEMHLKVHKVFLYKA